jgi:hypothetical protein
MTILSKRYRLGDGSRYRYADLQRVVAFRHASLVGDALSVALDFGEHVLIVSQADNIWPSHRLQRFPAEVQHALADPLNGLVAYRPEKQPEAQ